MDDLEALWAWVRRAGDGVIESFLLGKDLVPVLKDGIDDRCSLMKQPRGHTHPPTGYGGVLSRKDAAFLHDLLR